MSATIAKPRYEILVGHPNAIGKCHVRFIHSGKTLYEERFDPFDRRDTDFAIGEYLRISRRKIKRDVLRHDIQTAATTQADSIASTAKPIELIGMADFVQKFPDMREPIIEGLIRRGETCNVIAATKIGKSWLASDMALAVATGRPWLKRMDTKQGAVIYIDLELDPETFANRLNIIADKRELKIDELNDSFFPVCLRAQGHNINSIGAVIDQIKATGINVSMVVLDAWYRLIPEGVSENDNAAMMAMYNRLDQYAKQLDSAFVVVHHSSKGGQAGKAVTDVGSGAGSMARAADTHIVVRPDEKDNYAVMDVACRSFAPIEPISLFFTWPLWHIDDFHEAKLKQHKTSGAIKKEKCDAETVERIKSHFGQQEFTANDVRSALGTGRDRAARILTECDKVFESTGVRQPHRKDAGAQQLFKVRS